MPEQLWLRPFIFNPSFKTNGIAEACMAMMDCGAERVGFGYDRTTRAMMHAAARKA